MAIIPPNRTGFKTTKKFQEITNLYPLNGSKILKNLKNSYADSG